MTTESAVQRAYREECERRAAILALPEARGLADFAAHLAEHTDMSPEQARAAMHAAVGISGDAMIN